MLRTRGGVASVLLVLAGLAPGALPASAAPLDWEGTGSVLWGEPVGVPLGEGGGVATVNGSGAQGHLDSLELVTSRQRLDLTGTLPFVGGSVVPALRLEGELGGGNLAPISGQLTLPPQLPLGRLPIRGLLRLCLFSTDCANTLPVPLTRQTLTPSGAPTTVGIGLGGSIRVSLDGAPWQIPTVRISIQGAPWTVRTARVSHRISIEAAPWTVSGATVVTTLTAMGFVHGPASLTTSTAAPSGVVQLVTPSQISTNLTMDGQGLLGSIYAVRVHFVPEPGMLTLVAAGVIGLVVLGRLRR